MARHFLLFISFLLLVSFNTYASKFEGETVELLQQRLGAPVMFIDPLPNNVKAGSMNQFYMMDGSFSSRVGTDLRVGVRVPYSYNVLISETEKVKRPAGPLVSADSLFGNGLIDPTTAGILQEELENYARLEALRGPKTFGIAVDRASGRAGIIVEAVGGIQGDLLIKQNLLEPYHVFAYDRLHVKGGVLDTLGRNYSWENGILRPFDARIITGPPQDLMDRIQMHGSMQHREFMMKKLYERYPHLLTSDSAEARLLRRTPHYMSEYRSNPIHKPKLNKLPLFH